MKYIESFDDLKEVLEYIIKHYTYFIPKNYPDKKLLLKNQLKENEIRVIFGYKEGIESIVLNLSSYYGMKKVYGNKYVRDYPYYAIHSLPNNKQELKEYDDTYELNILPASGEKFHKIWIDGWNKFCEELCKIIPEHFDNNSVKYLTEGKIKGYILASEMLRIISPLL